MAEISDRWTELRDSRSGKLLSKLDEPGPKSLRTGIAKLLLIGQNRLLTSG